MQLADVVAVLEEQYPPALAETWDAVGLVCGDPSSQVRRVLFAVDPVEAVVDEALAWGADLLVTHHPLYLRGTTSVAATTPKGRVVHRLVTGGCGLLVAHTNADNARPGVSDALADLFGLRDTVPLTPQPAAPLDKLVAYVPVDDADRLLHALFAAGAGALGDYERCAWTTTGTGTFRPLPGASPNVGSVGEVARVPEARLEVVLPRRLRGRVRSALLAAHPYEQPAYDLLELASSSGVTGTGRVGELPAPLRLGALVETAATVLPDTSWGVRASGDADVLVSRLAVCGGAGDSLLVAAAGSRAQAFLTSDLRHHPASEAPEGLALLDAAHWATESPWCAAAAGLLQHRTRSLSTTLETRVSTLVTDPFGLSARSGTAMDDLA